MKGDVSRINFDFDLINSFNNTLWSVVLEPFQNVQIFSMKKETFVFRPLSIPVLGVEINCLRIAAFKQLQILALQSAIL